METNKKTSVVKMDMNGRHHCFDGKTFCIQNIFNVSAAFSADNLENEDAYERALKSFEEKWLRQRGITHIIGWVNFGDEREHTLDEFLLSL